MFKKIIVFILLSCTSAAFAMSSACNQPQLIKKIENWAIVSGNIAYISTLPTFSGSDLTYSVSAHPKNKLNNVTINRQTGKIRIKADGRDNFDVVVRAVNECGQISTTFNVQVDEED